MARPLNKMREEGGFYTRRPEIEACIDQALAQDPETVLRRAAIRKPADPDYMPLECLLHLMREARLARNRLAEGKLYLAFMVRCEAILKKAVPDDSRADAAGIREEIMQSFGALFARVGTNEDSTVLDYYEVNFNHAFRVLRIKALNKANTRASVFVDIGQEKDEDGNLLDDENMLARLSAAARSPAQQESYMHLVDVGKFLATLSPEDRETVRVVLIEGHQIECKEPGVVTAETILGVGARAIRKRLTKVAAALKKFQQES